MHWPNGGFLPQDTLEKCGKCGEVVRDHVIRALGKAFHPPCFTCVSCARCIGDESFALDNQNQVYCVADFYRWGRSRGCGRTGLGSGQAAGRVSGPVSGQFFLPLLC